MPSSALDRLTVNNLLVHELAILSALIAPWAPPFMNHDFLFTPGPAFWKLFVDRAHPTNQLTMRRAAKQTQGAPKWLLQNRTSNSDAIAVEKWEQR